MSDQEETKQVIVMRKDLNMRKGKMCAQASHASMAFLTRKLGIDVIPGDDGRHSMSGDLRPVEVEWLNHSFAKICVSVDSLDELMDLHTAAVVAGLSAHLVKDAGRTEFGGVPTYTCLAIGPDYVSAVDAVTGEAGPFGRLPLL